MDKKKAEHHYYMFDALNRFEYDMHHTIHLNRRIPHEWHEIATRRESAKKKICFSVEEDVLKWFKSMGPGYQPRMNDVLKGYMRAKLAGLLQSDDTVEAYRARTPEGLKPDWGDMERDMDALEDMRSQQDR